jgi:hypothetical protein
LKIIAKTGFRVEGFGTGNENFFALDIIGIGYTAIDRADSRAGLEIMEPNALGA